ncbi:hypothetical protein OCAR_5320 [Afipia carboxidovorans OM5]|nr:hypothetical protein OCAR_5320 [Afipia carboxidovorans OM5]
MRGQQCVDLDDHVLVARVAPHPPRKRAATSPRKRGEVK